MNVSIGQRWEEFVENLVQSGRYGSANDVLREGLRLVEEREAKIKALREHLDAAIADERRLTSRDVRASVREELQVQEHEKTRA